MDKLELKEWLLKNCENPKINLYIGSNKYIKTFYYYCEKELNNIIYNFSVGKIGVNSSTIENFEYLLPSGAIQ